jgi:uncharacterized flavoprotein (TIGR03862 family)
VAQVAIVGAGPAGLMAAEIAARAGLRVAVYDRMPSPARKFLLAGRGGLNLTHSEDVERLMTRYGSAAARLRPPLEALPPSALRAWCEDLGQPTFVGSSGRVFPTALKASPLLRAWLRRLDDLGVRLAPRHLWRGWDEAGALRFDGPDGPLAVRPDATVLALGGASWPRLGADGRWTDVVARAGIAVASLRPANCGFVVPWTEHFRTRFEGAPLKRIALTFGGETVRGEALVTRAGLEGGAVYALSARLREAIAAEGEAVLDIALRPDLDAGELTRKLSAPRGKQSFSTFLHRALRLPPVAIGLLNEAAAGAGTKLSTASAETIAQLVNAVPVRLTATAPIDRAISTAGGIALDEVDDTFMLRGKPGTFVAGEMLDWEAPTGGYLLQACFATGAAAGRGVVEWANRLRTAHDEPQMMS